MAEADAQIPGVDLEHLPPALSHPQALIPESSGYNRALAENQRKEFEEEAGLRVVLVKIGPNCRQDFFARQKNTVLHMKSNEVIVKAEPLALPSLFYPAICSSNASISPTAETE